MKYNVKFFLFFFHIQNVVIYLNMIMRLIRSSVFSFTTQDTALIESVIKYFHCHCLWKFSFKGATPNRFLWEREWRFFVAWNREMSFFFEWYRETRFLRDSWFAVFFAWNLEFRFIFPWNRESGSLRDS